MARDGGAISARQQMIAAPLLGEGRRVVEASHGGVQAATGPSVGLFGRVNAGRVSILGGIAHGRDEGGRAALDRSFSLALAARVFLGGDDRFHPFVELGGWTAPEARLWLSRTYANGSGTAAGTGSPDAGLSYLYARAGAALTLRDADELAFSAEIGRARLEADGYQEVMSAANPFEASVAAREETARHIRLRGQYTLALGSAFEATLWGAAVFAEPEAGSRVDATIAGFGGISATVEGSEWAEYGGRLAYRLGERVTVELFAQGNSRQDGAGSEGSAGLALRARF